MGVPVEVLSGRTTLLTKFAGLACQGLESLGVPYRLVDPGEAHGSTSPIIVWGWHLAHLWAGKRPIIVMERGYIGDRANWASIGLNGLNNRATFPDNRCGRFRQHFAGMMQPRHGGDYTLVIGQVDRDMAVRHTDIHAWYQHAVTQSRQRLGLPVMFRPHPMQRLCKDPPPAGSTLLEGDIDEALAGAAHVVTFNSNVGVLAVLAGCNTVVMDEGGMAWPVAAHDIGGVSRYNRDEWADWVAGCQWQDQEIANGEALRGVLSLVE